MEYTGVFSVHPKVDVQGDGVHMDVLSSSTHGWLCNVENEDEKHSSTSSKGKPRSPLCYDSQTSAKRRDTRLVGAWASAQHADNSAAQSVCENYKGRLRLFIDTADSKSWQRWLPSGAFYGVTTNPLLLERANVRCELKTLSELANRAFDLGAEEVQIQTWGQTVEEMVNTGSKLAEIIPGAIVVKIPSTKNGLVTASHLAKSGIPVTMTGVYSVHQALLAVGVGAAYAAPYLGRMVALGKPGMEDIQEMQQMVGGVKSDMRILVASIKDVKQITGLAARGVESFAIPVPIIEKLFQDGDTERAAADFEDAVSRTLEMSGSTSRLPSHGL